MAGVRDELILDISQAQRAIDALDRQLDSVFGSIDLDVNTAGIAQEITRATQAGDTSIPVTVDTAGIPAEITRAVNTADTDVRVDVDTSSARREVQALDRDLDKAAHSASGIGTILTGATILAGIRGLFGLAEASSAVSEQVTGSEIVFGNLAGEVQRFADQADRIGLGEAQALQLSNTFGQLALSAGLAGSEVNDFATTIVERGADIASLRDIDLTQTLDALRSGLVGETEPLRNIGIFINEALVATEAYRLGLAGLGDELTDQQKIQARYSLIIQQSEIAAGNFALTSEGLANKQRQVLASFRDLAADSGSILEPTFLNLANAAEADLIPALGELAEDALPALGSILEDLAPVLGVTLDLLIASAPILQLIADVIGIIPAPLFVVAGGWLAVSKAQQLATGTAAARRVDLMATKIGGLSRSFMSLSPGAAGAGLVAGVGALVAITNSGAGDDIGALAGSVLEMADSLTGFGSRREGRVSDELQELIGGLDLTKLSDGQTAIRRLTDELGGLDDQVGKGRLFSLGDVDIFATGGDASRQERIEQIREQIEALNEQAEAELTAGRDTGRFTEAQLAAAAAQASREGAGAPLLRQLQLLQLEEQRTARNAETIIERYDAVAAQYVNTADAAGRLRNAAPEVESAIAGIRQSGQGSDTQFLNLATAIDAAELSSEGMADTAALLGTDVASLTGFVDEATGALQDFVDTAVGGLPTVADVFDDALSDAQDAATSAGTLIRDAAADRAQAVLDAAADQIAAGGKDLAQADADYIRESAELRAEAIRDGAEVEAAAVEDAARVSAAGLTASLRDRAEALADFRSDLEQLNAGGFTDLAGLLARQGMETGDALADELAAALDAGNVEILQGLREANDAFQTESAATVDFIRDDLGPELLSVTGLLSSAISENFGENLDFEEKVRIAGALASTELDSQGKQIAAVAAVEGERAAREYGAALGLDQAVIDAGVAAGLAINGIPLRDFRDGGRRIGAEIGTGIVDGFSYALLQAQTAVSDKAAQLVLQAEAAMRRAGEIQSPSRLFARIGAYLGEGVVAGIDSRAGAVAASAGRIVVGAADAAAGFRVRPSVQTMTQSGVGGIDYDRLASAIAAQMRPNVTFAPVVHNPVATTAESSIDRELRSSQLRNSYS